MQSMTTGFRENNRISRRRRSTYPEICLDKTLHKSFWPMIDIAETLSQNVRSDVFETFWQIKQSSKIILKKFSND